MKNQKPVNPRVIELQKKAARVDGLFDQLHEIKSEIFDELADISGVSSASFDRSGMWVN